MRVVSFVLSAGMLLPSLTASAAARPHHHTSTHALVRHSTDSRVHRAERSGYEHPVSSMSPERATQIQTALIARGYLSGEPSGTWDASSMAAMQKLQGDNGWQTKLVPDSRALIKLGLGPGSTPVAAPSAAGAPASTTAAAVEPPPAF